MSLDEVYCYMFPVWYIVFAICLCMRLDRQWYRSFREYATFSPYCAAGMALALAVAWPAVLFIFTVGMALQLTIRHERKPG